MNTKIFTLIQKNLQSAFNLPKYQKIVIDADTPVDQLPWTPARYTKFKDAVEAELSLPCDYQGTLQDIVDDLSERYILRFFSEIWKPRTGDYEHTGWELADEINQLNPVSVLDVGCGYHPFKGRIQNLIGIDPANDLADIKFSIEDFSSDNTNWNKFDVAFCLGSIIFGNKLNIMNQIACVINCLKPTARIYWRCNPGLADHGNEECKSIEFYPWTTEEHVKLSELFGFKLVTSCWDGNRIYAEWSRSA
jgi:hypothetical protein